MKKISLLSALLLCFGAARAGMWIQRANFGGLQRAYGPIAFNIGSYAYVGLGYNGSTYFQDIWEYDQANDVWTQKANFPGAGSQYAACFASNGKGYVGTGRFVSNCYNYLYQYDPGTNTWTQKANFGGVVRCAAMGFSIGNYGFIGSGGLGYTSLTYYQDFWRYNTGTNSWTQMANFTGFGRDGAVGLSIGDKGYMGLGWANPYKSDFWEYDTTSNAWTQKASFGGGARIPGAWFSIGTKAYVGMGYDGSSERNDFWEWDQFLNIWTQCPSFPGGYRSQLASTAINGKGYAGLGYDGNVHYKDWWEYDPALTTGVDPAGNELSFTVYPNPVSDHLNVSVSGVTDEITLSLFDLRGTLLQRVIATEPVTQFDMSTYAKGVYLLRAEQGHKSSVKKVIVNGSF